MLVGSEVRTVESPESQRLLAVLAERAGSGADGERVADVISTMWQEIDAELSPIIGRGGAAALYRRSLYLTATTHPGLAGTHELVESVVESGPLKAALSAQSRADALAAGTALMQSFYELLTSLVGPSLTERLLRSVGASPASASPTQDTSL